MYKGLIFPQGYHSALDIMQTEKAIKLVKDFFQINLAAELKLRRATAPLFVLKGTGINDDLNGIERPVSFAIKNMNNIEAEVVQSLAKWKRMMLADLGIEKGYGLYTDMNAIRPDEEIDNLHSLYVDQWDWELHISVEERNIEFLKNIVKRIYSAIKRTEYLIYESFPQISPVLSDDITFIHSEDLLKMYPKLTSVERENAIARKHGSVFIIGIGAKLSNGEKHDGRAPDYDDWISLSDNNHRGLNGDIIIWNPVLQCAFELSSMGIRVDKESLLKQLELEHAENRKELMFHRRLLNDELPLSIGGGIGQSRLCMFLLRKAHIGEIQSSIWPEEMRIECLNNGINLL